MWFRGLFKKKKSNKVIKENKNFTTVAFVALSEKELPSIQKFSEEYRKNFKESLFVNKWKEDVGTIDVDNKQVIITLMPHRINWEEINESCERSWYFKDGKNRMKQHRAHLVVSINGKMDEQIENSIILSKVIASIIMSTDVLGVYWYSIQTLRAPEDFVGKVIDMNMDNLPIELWMDIRIRLNGSFSQDIYTVGLDKLGLKNIEIINSRIDYYLLYIFIYEASLNMICNTVQYINGEFIEEGKYRFKILHTKGTIVDDKEVIKFELQ